MTSANLSESHHADEATLMDALAIRIAGLLRSALDAGRSASLAVPGGRTPVALFRRLAAVPLDWARVVVTLTDERWVSTDSEFSNEGLVRKHLLQNAARSATLVGLKNGAANPAAGAAQSWQAVAALPHPFDVVVLGMGEDGHFASLFPASPGLRAALDSPQPGCAAMTAPTEPRARISLNLTALLDARLIALPVMGAIKHKVYDSACEAGPAEELPVRALLRQQRTRLEVYRSP